MYSTKQISRVLFLQVVSFIALLLTVNSVYAAKVQFNRDIKPILSDSCYLCHGPDANSRKAKLRLDIREEAIKPASSGETPLVPGKPEESELYKRLIETDKDLRMPPDEAHKTLTIKQKELIRQWIIDGANYETHWAYAPLKAPETPQVAQKEFVYNSIDNFIVAKLQEKEMSPSKTAEKLVLMRRLYLDLTGLPPTLREQQEYLADQSPQAYEKLVDKLLDSPRYGERMGAWWLDVARYTDTVGFHGDQNQRVFPYRDYVINAFNKNLPFDQFTKEQLAGDLLPDHTDEQLVATCFNRLNMMTREGGAQSKEYLAKYGADRVRTVGTAWLGATLACCECHSHKFDPFTTKDFYAMQAYFADVKQYGVYSNYIYTPEPDLVGYNNDFPFPPEIQIDSPYLKKFEQETIKNLHQQTEVIKNRSAVDKNLANNFQQWKQGTTSFFASHPAGWHALPVDVKLVPPAPPKGQKPATPPAPPEFKLTENQEVILLSKTENNIVLDYVADKTETLSVIKLELIPNAEFKNTILRNKTSGSVNLKLSLSVSANNQKAQTIDFHHALSHLRKPDYQGTEELRSIINKWETLPENSSKLHTGYWFTAYPLVINKGDRLIFRLDSPVNPGCFRVSISPIITAKLLLDLEEYKSCPAEHQLDEWWEAYMLSSPNKNQEWNTCRSLLTDYLKCNHGKAWVQVTKQMEPLTIRVLPRGNWQDETGEIVKPHPPEFMSGKPAPDEKRQNRLDLANWLCSKENPLTGRNVMNRLWKQFFGHGISAVVEDLGAQGEPPVHPELLDYLAVQFRDHGWNFKRMIKMIVMSRTYQQDSSLNPAYRDKDPQNRYLSSQNARRLDAEFIRDNALAISGLINLDMGGPACFPYQPEGYYRELQFPNRDYFADKDNRQYRRGVYMHWQRTFLHPMLANFDAPNRDECTANRVYSNTPQQALTLLNDPTFTEASRYFAAYVIDNKKSVDERLTLACQTALARSPREKEIDSIKKMIPTLESYYKDHPEDAVKLISIGLKPDTTHDKTELATWTNICRIILNLHETITRY